MTLAMALSMIVTGRALDHHGWTPRGVGAGLSLVYFLGAGIFELLILRARAQARRLSSVDAP
jgi:hypothetical protein